MQKAVEPMRVLLTGGTGLLGWTLLQRMPADWQIFVTTHKNPNLPSLGAHVETLNVDLRSQQQIQAAVERALPDVVIHTASVGNLDVGEAGKDEAWQINVLGTQYLLEACQPYQPHITHCSTIYVFDGEHPPYSEQSVPAPLSFYGKTKLASEEVAQQLSQRLLIMRLNTVYGWHLPGQRLNWVTWILGKLQANQPVMAVNDIYNNLVWVEDVASAILSGVTKAATGLYHVGGQETLSRYDFSLKIAKEFGYNQELISPVSDDFFPTMVPRPKNTTCSIDKMVNELGVVPATVEQGLHQMREQQRVKSLERQ